jgi:putative aldouronate transport system substrate-binding protein
MKNVWKRMLNIAVVSALLVTSFVGCGGKEAEGGTDAATTQTAAATTDAASTAAAGAEEITLKGIHILGKDVAAPPRPSPLDKLLKEKFNINVEWEDVTYEKEKFNLLFASEEYPDFIYNINDETTVKGWGTAGYLVPVNDYLDKIPNYKNMWTEEDWNTTYKFAKNADNNLYYLPTKNYRNASMSWIYRKGKFDEFGLTYPRTTDELYNALKTIRQKDPNSVPIVNRWGIQNLLNGFTNAFRTSSIYSNAGFYMDPDSNTFDFAPISEKYRNMLSYMRKLYGEGMIDKEFQTATDTQWEEAYAKGMSYIEFSYTTRAAWANDMMKTVDPNANWQWTSDFITADPGKPSLYVREKPFSPWGMVITKKMSQEGIDRLMQYVNWACTEEGLQFNEMGEEGVTFEMKDGKPMFLPEFKSVRNNTGKVTGEVGYEYFLGRYGPALEDMGYTTDLELSEKVKDMASLQFINFNLSVDQEKELVDYETQIKDIVEEYTLKFIMGSMEPTKESDWEQYTNALNKTGLDKVKEIRSQALEK